MLLLRVCMLIGFASLTLVLPISCANCPTFYLKAGGQDGFGGETIARIGVMTTALHRGLKYCHAPYHRLHHVGGGEQSLEKFMNLSGAARLLFGSDDPCDMKHTSVLLGKKLVPRKKIVCNKQKHVIGVCTKTHICASVFSSDPSKVMPLLPSLRAAYGLILQDTFIQNSRQTAIKIAIHVRRGDVPDSRRLSNEKLSYVVSFLRKKYESLGGVEFHIYSQGIREDFGFINRQNVFLHLSSPTIPCRYGLHGMAKHEICTNHTVSDASVNELMNVFHALVSSEVLVVANSALSYAAGIYCKGVVYYLYERKDSFVGGRKPIPLWIPIK